jgi:solute carrier family 25 (mitochondrial phosphate transporter), member 3
MAKFVVYEKAAEAIFAYFPKEKMSNGMVTASNLGAGLVAGFAAAIISQPADTMLSKINKTKGLPGESTTSRLIKIAGELGFRGSYAGIGARLFMVGTLTAGQFAIYGDVSVSRIYAVGYVTDRNNQIKRVLGATGGVEISK